MHLRAGRLMQDARIQIEGGKATSNSTIMILQLVEVCKPIAYQQTSRRVLICHQYGKLADILRVRQAEAHVGRWVLVFVQTQLCVAKTRNRPDT